MRSLSPPEILRAGHTNVIRAFEGIVQLMPRGTAEHWNGISFIHTGMPAASFNLAFALDAPPSLEGVADRIQRILVEGGTPWILVATPATVPSLAPLIDRFHLRQTEVLPAMVRDLPAAVSPPSPPGLEIHRATTPEEVRRALRTGAEGFEVAPDFFDAWIERWTVEPPEPGPSKALYLGYVDGKPVCTALAVLTPPAVGIYFVATLPSFRRRGLGAAMTHRAAIDGLRDGCSLSVLQASEMGRPVYERIGYRAVEEYLFWAPESDAGEDTSPPA